MVLFRLDSATNMKEHCHTRNGSSGVAVVCRIWNALNEIADFHS
jgi:hypothetical protein